MVHGFSCIPKNLEYSVHKMAFNILTLANRTNIIFCLKRAENNF